MVLNQVVAIEKGIKSDVYSKITNLHKTSQKTDLFNGFIKNYQPKDDEGDTFPSEKKKVQMNVNDNIKDFSTYLLELFDITASKDYANCNAKADIKVGGEVILKDVPSTYLLFLEKQLKDIETFIKNLPILDEAEDWILDASSNLYKTAPILTHKTKKVQKPIVLYDATDRHPAQTQMVSEDIVVGYWNNVKYSGAMALTQKKEMLSKVEKLSQAVKKAREEANMTKADKKDVGGAIFKYLFS